MKPTHFVFSIIALMSLFITVQSCNVRQPAPISDQLIRSLKAGIVDDDSSCVYWLPYKEGSAYRLVQGWASSFSHNGELSLDFKMKVGNEIYAAREGIVVAAKENSTVGGLEEEYLDDGNHVVIKHSDGSYAGYWHLNTNGAFVAKGDSVKKGQKIGISGNTGYTAFPHLHFYVYRIKDGQKETIPVRFYTVKGIRYLRPGRKYTCVREWWYDDVLQ